MNEVLSQEKLKTLQNSWRSSECCGLPEFKIVFSAEMDKVRLLLLAYEEAMHRLDRYIHANEHCPKQSPGDCKCFIFHDTFV